MRQKLVESTYTIYAATNGTATELEQDLGYCVHAIWTDKTSGSKTMGTVDASEDTITITGHGLSTGMRIAALTTTTTLPAGLSTSTPYWVIVVDVDTIQIASTYANAIAGTQIDITDAGTGTHTVTFGSLSGAVKLQCSLDGTNYIDVASSSQNITGSSEYIWNVTDVFYNYVRPVFSLTAGAYEVKHKINTKGF